MQALTLSFGEIIDELKSALTYFNLNGEWSLVDPYYGIIFLNLQ